MNWQSGPNGRVRLRIEDEVAELRLSHPEKLNCFSLKLGEDLHDLTLAVADRDDITATVITAEGKSFSAGADLEILESDDPSEIEQLEAYWSPVFEWMREGDVPVVAGGRGPVVGAGATLFCYAADLRVAGEDAEIWFPEIEHGLAPFSRAVALAQDIGVPHALELMLLGEDGKLPAAEVHDLGLVNRVVAPDRVDEEAREMARIIAKNDRKHDLVSDFLDVIHQSRLESSGASAAYAARKRREHQRRQQNK